MALTVRDLKMAADYQRQYQLADLAHVRRRTDAIGQALDAWNRSYGTKLADLARAWDRSNSAQLADLARTSNIIGQALNNWNRNFSGQLAWLAHVQHRADSITQALNVYGRRFDLVVEPVPFARRTEQEAVGATDLVIPPRGVDWPPFGQIALRALVLTFFILLSAALWEEKRDTAPAEAIAEILSLLAIWGAVDHWIWRRLS